MARRITDPTADKAIGRVDKEMERMQEYAQLLDELRKEGKLSPEEIRQARKLFIGIYKNYF